MDQHTAIKKKKSPSSTSLDKEAFPKKYFEKEVRKAEPLVVSRWSPQNHDDKKDH